MFYNDSNLHRFKTAISASAEKTSEVLSLIAQ